MHPRPFRLLAGLALAACLSASSPAAAQDHVSADPDDIEALLQRYRVAYHEQALVALPDHAGGSPSTYMVDGRQYIAVTVGDANGPGVAVLGLPD